MKINAKIPAILWAIQQKNLFPTKELIWNQSGWIVWNQALASTELRHWWDYELAGLINAICTHWPELRSFALVILARRFNNISFINIANLILMFYFKVKLCAFASHITLFSLLQTVSFGLTCPESTGIVKQYPRCSKICLIDYISNVFNLEAAEILWPHSYSCFIQEMWENIPDVSRSVW